MADVIISQKTCTACGQTKPIGFFGKAAAYKDGHRSQCTPCRSAKNAKYVAGQLGPRRKADPVATRRTKLKQRYALTEFGFAELLAKQNGGCAICRSANPGGRWGVFHVDHCHETGQVRGLLCHGCNIALGAIGDSLTGVLRFMSYLTSHEQSAKSKATQLENSKGQ